MTSQLKIAVNDRQHYLLVVDPFVQDYAYANRGFDFIEMQIGKEPKGFLRMTPLTDSPFVTQSIISQPESRFGISWDDISTPADRKYWVAGSRLRIVDLKDKSIVAERIGFLIEAGFGSRAGHRRPWIATRGPNTACPSIINRDHGNRFFVLKVLRTNEGDTNVK